LYIPPKGIDVAWLNWEAPDIVVAEFGCSDLQPEMKFRKSKADILHELGTNLRHRIITEDLTGAYHIQSPRFMKLDVVLNHPLITNAEGPNADEIRRAADSASEVHDIEVTKEGLEQMKHSLNTDKTRGLRKQQFIAEPKERRLKTRKIYDRDRDGKPTVKEEFQEEVFVYQSGTIDSG